MNQDRPARGNFPSTHWSMIDAAAADETDVRRAALARFLQRYMKPMRSYLLRRKRVSVEQADDLLQGFLLSRIIEVDLIQRAEREKGRFRSFLLTALDRFVSNEYRAARAIKRSPQAMVDLDGVAEPAAQGGAVDEAFELAWAREVLGETVARMHRQCQTSARDDVWHVFEGRVLAPIMEGKPPVDYGDLVRLHGLKSVEHANNLLTTAKRMFARAMRSVVGEYESGEAGIEEELADLRRALAAG